MTSLFKTALAIPFMIGLAAAPALAGSATNESVSEQLALERTLSDVPERCRDHPFGMHVLRPPDALPVPCRVERFRQLIPGLIRPLCPGPGRGFFHGSHRRPQWMS